MAKPSGTLSKVNSALVSICSAVSWASPQMSDSAIVKQPAWAAPISSSAFAPGFVEMVPSPSCSPYAVQRRCHALPVLRPVRALLARVFLGPRPSLHCLLGRLPGSVRQLPRCIAEPAADHQTGPDQLCSAPGAHQKARIAAGLQQSSAEIAADRACADHEN